MVQAMTAALALAAQSRWMDAIATQNASELSALLAPDFEHVNYRGVVQDRSAELAGVSAPKPFTQQLEDVGVVVYGDIAIVRGVNAVSQDGHVVIRLRYTDVYGLDAQGNVQALSAQESAIS